MVAANGCCLARTFACRQAPTGEKPGLCLCRSQPAVEGWRSTGVASLEHSLAGKLLQGKNQVFVFVGASLLAKGGGKRASPQAKIRLQACLLQGKNQVFVFVGASLLANGGGKRASPQAKIRLQACFLQGENDRASLCRSQPAGEGWLLTGVASGKDPLADKLLQGENAGLVFVGASLLANGGGQRDTHLPGGCVSSLENFAGEVRQP